MKQTLTIGWLYPELMSTYGDRGNIITLQKRCEWRGIYVEIKKLDVGFSDDELKKCDLLFMGGAQDKQQEIVSRDFSAKKTGLLRSLVEDGLPGLYVCGAYQFLGNYYKEANGTKIPGLGILDLHTENPGEDKKRLIGNIIIEKDGNQLVGFENHGGRTYLGEKVRPLGKVLKGFGNNETDKTEGAVYKNTFGTYLHGPILPKNPEFADLLIKLALEKKYGEKIDLKPLDDSLEQKAKETILQKIK